MRTKQKYKKIFFISLILTFVLSIFITIIIFIVNSNKSYISSSPEIENKEPDEKDKKDFKSDNLTIGFNTAQNIYILQRNKDNYYFHFNNFKYFFLLEFYKLGPISSNVNFQFSLDDENNTRSINVIYKLDLKDYYWLFKIN
ncbi:hypothetical protein [Spiroplasma turonicum]|uniref:Uncharacterized protein n=1 Tax=Spiroplasma turonicum TaxID=216946 RepID=A0A0K1P643_9MOLU|nr:hypothetical protein [Spiroplasma turonicum]AKU79387.1 hypothetical protein STURON_00141 [Spiroplasma turonicum]ALX70408.1 hypothetical protein STURO_v1c01390 [Spiroplasma turonicum]